MILRENRSSTKFRSFNQNPLSAYLHSSHTSTSNIHKAIARENSQWSVSRKHKKLFAMTFRVWCRKKKMVVLVMSTLRDRNFRVDWVNSPPSQGKQPSMEANRIVVVKEKIQQMVQLIEELRWSYQSHSIYPSQTGKRNIHLNIASLTNLATLTRVSRRSGVHVSSNMTTSGQISASATLK